MKNTIACLMFIGATSTATAQVQVDAATQQLVQSTTERFFAHLSADAYDAQYAMMSPGLAGMLPADRWKDLRTELSDKMGGTPETFIAHRQTYYDQGQILAAVDFSGQGSNPEQVVCGFLLWEIGPDESIALKRIEQNLAEVDVMDSLPVQKAAQLMADWYCPVPVIEEMLDIKIP